MKKTLTFACAFTLISTFVLAQGHKEKIQSTAQLLADATVKEDYSTVLDHTYPKFVEANGGKDSLILIIKAGFKKLKEQATELSISNVTIGEPGDEIKIGSMLYSIVPESMILKYNGKKYSTTGSLIGISSDNGENWTFVDTGSLNEVKKVLPDINQLSIPASTGPTPVKDN